MKPNDLHFLLILFFIVKGRLYGKCNESRVLRFALTCPVSHNISSCVGIMRRHVGCRCCLNVEICVFLALLALFPFMAFWFCPCLCLSLSLSLCLCLSLTLCLCICLSLCLSLSVSLSLSPFSLHLLYFMKDYWLPFLLSSCPKGRQANSTL